MKFIKSILSSIMYTAIYFILQVIVQLIMMFGWGYSFALKNLSLSVIISSIISFLIYWGIIKLRKQKLSLACSFKKFDHRQTPILLVLGFSLQYFFQGLLLIFRLEELFPDHAIKIKLIFEGGTPLMIILSVVILAPFIEEILFRGLIINELKGKIHIMLVIFIQALIFGLIHGNSLQIAYASILGIVLGLISTWSRSVWPAIIVHISMNGTPLLTELLRDTDQVDQFISTNKIPVTITCGVLVIAIMYFIYRKNHMESKISTIEIPDSATI